MTPTTIRRSLPEIPEGIGELAEHGGQQRSPQDRDPELVPPEAPPQLGFELAAVDAGDLARIVDELDVGLHEVGADVRRQRATSLRRPRGPDQRPETSGTSAIPVELSEDPGVEGRHAVVGERDVDRQRPQTVLETDRLDGPLRGDRSADERGDETKAGVGHRAATNRSGPRLHAPIVLLTTLLPSTNRMALVRERNSRFGGSLGPRRGRTKRSQAEDPSQNRPIS
jgi:hypothetical protein